MKKARLELIFSMIIFGTLGIFVKHISLSSGELALCRALLAAILTGIYLLVTKDGISFAKVRKELPLLLFSGAALGINWILLFEAYKYTTVSAATLSYYFAPILVTMICPILFKEKLTKKQAFCSCMAAVGVAMIIGVSGSNGGEKNLQGVLLGLGAAVFYATVILLNKFIKEVAGLHRTLLQFLAAIVVLLPYVLLTGGLHLHTLNSIGWLNLVIVGLVHTGLSYCLYFSSLKELRGQEAAILSYIDPLTAVLVSVLFLKEKITVWQIVGGIFILGFAILNEKWEK